MAVTNSLDCFLFNVVTQNPGHIINSQVGCIPCTANTIGESKKHAVGLIGENDEILMVRKTHPTEKYMPANNDEPQLAYTVQEHYAHFCRM